MIRAGLRACLCLLLTSCAAVDQFGSRIYDGNLNSQTAMNQEILLNVVRASRLQPLNFVAISQVSGGQTETVNTGLPTITIGPLQTAAQHQFQVTNSVTSNVTGGYVSNPLVTTEFQTGMLSPVDEKVVAYLVAAHPREPVLYAVTASISFQIQKSRRIIRLVNDPTRDTPFVQCPQRVNDAPTGLDPTLLSECNYSLFLRYFKVLILAGLTSELAIVDGGASGGTSRTKESSAAPTAGAASRSNSASSKGKSANSGSGSASTTSTVGHLCFDPTRSNEGINQPKCGEKLSRSPKQLTLHIDDVGTVSLALTLRSPAGVFAYYGAWLNPLAEGWQIDNYGTDQARKIIGNEPFLNVTAAKDGFCFASVSYQGESFCVPSYSHHTAMLFDIVIQLRNLNIQPADLNAPFTVRLAN